VLLSPFGRLIPALDVEWFFRAKVFLEILDAVLAVSPFVVKAPDLDKNKV